MTQFLKLTAFLLTVSGAGLLQAGDYGPDFDREIRRHTGSGGVARTAGVYDAWSGYGAAGYRDYGYGYRGRGRSFGPSNGYGYYPLPGRHRAPRYAPSIRRGYYGSGYGYGCGYYGR